MRKEKKQEVIQRGRELTSDISADRESIQSQGGTDVYEFSITSRVAGERTHCFSIFREDKTSQRSSLLVFSQCGCCTEPLVEHTWLRGSEVIVLWLLVAGPGNPPPPEETSTEVFVFKNHKLYLFALSPFLKIHPAHICHTCNRQSIGVYPALFATSAFAPCCKRTSTILEEQFAQALCRGVCCFLPAVLGSAPAPSSI